MKNKMIMLVTLMSSMAYAGTRTETDSMVWTQSGTFSNGAIEKVKTTPSSTTSNNFGSFYALDTEFVTATTSTLTSATWTNYGAITSLAYSSYNIERGRVYINCNTQTLVSTNYNIVFTYYDSPSSNDWNMVYQSQMGLTYTIATNGAISGATNILCTDNSTLYAGALIWVGPMSSEFVRVTSLPTTNNIIFGSAFTNYHATNSSICRVREFSGGVCDSTRSYQFNYMITCTNSPAPASNIVVYLEYYK